MLELRDVSCRMQDYHDSSEKCRTQGAVFHRVTCISIATRVSRNRHSGSFPEPNSLLVLTGLRIASMNHENPWRVDLLGSRVSYNRFSAWRSRRKTDWAQHQACRPIAIPVACRHHTSTRHCVMGRDPCHTRGQLPLPSKASMNNYRKRT